MSLESVYDSVEYESHRELKKYKKLLKQVNEYSFRGYSDDELKGIYQDWVIANPNYDPKNKRQKTFLMALAREVTYRLLGKFQYDVQVLGALAATDRNMVQMSTGSGKTITLILSAIVLGMTHKGTYVLTVNDYLSKRDWEETHVVYDWFNLSSAYVTSDSEDDEQVTGFSSDIIYCTNSSLGFAYLNSKLASDIGDDIKVIKRPLYAALVDEADEILMDDAQNPLIIATAKDVTEAFTTIDHNGQAISVQEIVDKMKTLAHLDYDEDSHQVNLSASSLNDIEKKLNLDDSILTNHELMHAIYTAADAIFQQKNEADYIVAAEPDENTGSRIILIDRATGRLAPGRTMSDDLHLFVEMKERVFSGQGTESSIQITYQMLFNLFETFAGLTGTLGTSFNEFQKIYNTGVVVIPDRKPNQLQSQTELFASDVPRNVALIHQIKWFIAAHHPVLIGASSDIQVSILSRLLSQNGIDHKTLTSTDKNEEAIVKDAGQPGSVVITTDIMGRGTDIKVIDTAAERRLVVFQIGKRENARIERQFAGRAARQGQPGRYYRMLTFHDLTEINLSEIDMNLFYEDARMNREEVKHYHGDILLDGHHDEYEERVRLIDEALLAQESGRSTQRIQDFQSYSITDIIQSSILGRLEIIRKALKHALATSQKADMDEVILTIMTMEMTKRQAKKFRKKMARKLDDYPSGVLEEKVMTYMNTIIDEFLPRLRDAAKAAERSTTLARQVKYEVSTQTFMYLQMQGWMNENHHYLELKLD